MERNFLAFCHRQSAKMIEYADDCTDPEQKSKFLQMAASWLKRAAPSRHEQPTVAEARC